MHEEKESKSSSGEWILVLLAVIVFVVCYVSVGFWISDISSNNAVQTYASQFSAKRASCNNGSQTNGNLNTSLYSEAGDWISFGGSYTPTVTDLQNQVKDLTKQLNKSNAEVNRVEILLDCYWK